MEENFKKDMKECVDSSNKDIDLILLKNRNANLNKNEKIMQLRKNLVDGFTKLFYLKKYFYFI